MTAVIPILRDGEVAPLSNRENWSRDIVRDVGPGARVRIMVVVRLATLAMTTRVS